MNKEFVLPEEAVALKQLGFDEKSYGWYMDFKNPNLQIHTEEGKAFLHNTHKLLSPLNRTSAPLYQQAFRWFRKNHQIDGWVCPDYSGKVKRKNVVVYCYNVDMANHNETKGGFHTYEKAELACLKKLIEIVKNK